MTSHSDNVSIFSYDGKEPPDTFNLDSLLDVVEKHFKTPCSLRKLTAGGYHKASLTVARVACPAFPGDKLRSEVATLQYIALHTSVPVPEVYHWNADATNEVGAEYMIMQKIPGTPAVYIWNDLSFPIKERVVRQVAEHLSALFALRFAHAGSLYTPDASLPTATSSTPQPPQFYVGPAVSDNFYRAIEGHVDYASTDLHVPGSPSFLALQKFRGPFSSASDFIAHPLKALIYKCTTFPEESLEAFKDEPEKLGKPEVLLQRAVEAMEKGLELVKVYPGDADIYEVSTPDRPFTFFWDDFRLINIMVRRFPSHKNWSHSTP
ncbi:hypothetical protein DL96DRAFT_1460872 [Flagelloscypha sp. PMI_526]|nr:hypothetical protein DL96DRAFT_1460872 [Flagelloscypha sp. PMI_526]